MVGSDKDPDGTAALTDGRFGCLLHTYRKTSSRSAYGHDPF